MERGKYFSAENDNIPVDHRGIEQEDQRLELFEEFGLFHESLEDFCNRMAEAHGDNWVNILTR